jgi:phospholipase/lecithinase/hemolysin
MVSASLKTAHKFRVWLWLACWLSLPSAVTGQEFSRLFVVGDSLSDTGNAAAARDAALGVFAYDRTLSYTFGLCSPLDKDLQSCGLLFSERRRVGDGPLAAERLSEGLNLGPLAPSLHLLPVIGIDRPFVGSNYAVASAKARGTGPEDLTAQVDALVLDHSRPTLPAGALYLFVIGGNDALDALQAVAAFFSDEERSEASGEIIGAAVEAIAFNLQRLIDSGARHILVLNVPNIGALPAVRNSADGLLRVLGRRTAAALARTFNVQLWSRLRDVQLRSPSAKVEIFDLYTAFELERARAFFSGRNIDDACFDTKKYFDEGVRSFHPDCAPSAGGVAADFGEFIFWDDLHPTARIHAAIGDDLVEAARDLVDGS